MLSAERGADKSRVDLEEGRQLTLPEANKIVNSIYSERIDFADRFHNTFFYEICPILTIANYIKDEILGLRFTGKNERFDGEIWIHEATAPVRIEMTAGIDGHNDALQMELINQQGHAPAFQKIRATGTKRKREFGKNEIVAVSLEEHLFGWHVPLIKRAISRKFNIAGRNPDYCGAWLGIVFEDSLVMPREKRLRYLDPMCQAILSDISTYNHYFTRIFLIGVSREYIFDSKAGTGCLTDWRNTPL